MIHLRSKQKQAQNSRKSPSKGRFRHRSRKRHSTIAKEREREPQVHHPKSLPFSCVLFRGSKNFLILERSTTVREASSKKLFGSPVGLKFENQRPDSSTAYRPVAVKNTAKPTDIAIYEHAVC